MVWNVWAPSKCKFFMWIMLQNRVWTADRLLLREWPNCYFCQLCWRSLETTMHLFSECPTSRIIWSSISSRCSWPVMNPTSWRVTDDLAGWFFDLVGNSNSPEAKGVLWRFWSAGASGANAIVEFSMTKWSHQQESSMKWRRLQGCGHRLVLNTWPF